MDHDPHLSSPVRGESGMMRFFLPGLVVGMVLGSMLGLYVGTRSGGAKLPDSITSMPRVTGPGSHGEDERTSTPPSERNEDAPPATPDKPAEEKPAEKPAEKPQEPAPKTP
jgi:cell division protein FtsN